MFIFIGEFLLNCIESLAIGGSFGLLATWLLKKGKALEEEAAFQTALILYLAYMSYIVAEIANASGVIALLVCSIVLGHYAWYNMSHDAQVNSKSTINILSFSAEALTFVYIGICVITYSTEDYSVDFMFFIIGIVMASRLILVYGMYNLFKLCKPHRFVLK